MRATDGLAGVVAGALLLLAVSACSDAYLLDFGNDNIAIYVIDHPGRFSLEDYDAVVQTILFDAR